MHFIEGECFLSVIQKSASKAVELKQPLTDSMVFEKLTKLQVKSGT